MLLLHQHDISKDICLIVGESLIAELGRPSAASSRASDLQQEFVRKCLQTLLALGDVSYDVVIELMTQYIVAPVAFRFDSVVFVVTARIVMTHVILLSFCTICKIGPVR